MSGTRKQMFSLSHSGIGCQWPFPCGGDADSSYLNHCDNNSNKPPHDVSGLNPHWAYSLNKHSHEWQDQNKQICSIMSLQACFLEQAWRKPFFEHLLDSYLSWKNHFLLTKCPMFLLSTWANERKHRCFHLSLFHEGQTEVRLAVSYQAVANITVMENQKPWNIKLELCEWESVTTGHLIRSFNHWPNEFIHK